MSENNYLTITENTIKYGDNVYQLKNITHVGKYTVNRRRVRNIIAALILAGIGFFLLSMGVRGDFIQILILGSWGVAAVLLLWGIFSFKKYALVVETSSGRTEIFTASKERFVDEIISQISEVMENPQKGTNITYNMEKMEITDESTHKYVEGDEVSGDKFDHVKDSSIVNHSSNVVNQGSHSINQSPDAQINHSIVSNYSEEVAEAIADLEKHISNCNEPGSSLLMNKLKEQMSQPKPDNSKASAIWNSLVRILPDASSVAVSIATIASIFI